jgi:hypothetical protein
MITLTERVAQVEYIDQVAQGLTSMDVTLDDYNGDTDAFVEDVIRWWQEDPLGEIPDWWNEHDTNLLKHKVREYITK